MTTTPDLVWLAAALIIGFILGLIPAILLAKSRSEAAREAGKQEMATEIATLQERLTSRDNQLQHIEAELTDKEVEFESLSQLRTELERDKARLSAEFVDHYANAGHPRTTLFPGIQDCLEELADAGIGIGVCSNKPQDSCEALLADLGVAGLVSAVHGSSPGIPAEPDPTSLFRVLLSLKANPAASLYVGDSDTDVKTARAAGMPVILVGWGYTATPAADLGADAVIETFDDLSQIRKLPPKSRNPVPWADSPQGHLNRLQPIHSRCMLRAVFLRELAAHATDQRLFADSRVIKWEFASNSGGITSLVNRMGSARLVPRCGQSTRRYPVPRKCAVGSCRAAHGT